MFVKNQMLKNAGFAEYINFVPKNAKKVARTLALHFTKFGDLELKKILPNHHGGKAGFRCNSTITNFLTNFYFLPLQKFPAYPAPITSQRFSNHRRIARRLQVGSERFVQKSWKFLV